MKVKKGNLKKIESAVYAGAIRALLLIVAMNFINFNSLLAPHSSWHIVYLFVSFVNLMYMCTRVAFLKQDVILEWVNDMVETAKNSAPAGSKITVTHTSTPVTPIPSELSEIDSITQTTTKDNNRKPWKWIL